MSDSLPSWRDTATRTAIFDFVAAVTDENGPDYVVPEARVAVFDNDGTLWTEKPMPTQLHYLLEQWKAAAAADPSLADTQPYQAAASGDMSWLSAAIDRHYAGDDADLGLLIAAVASASGGVSVDEYAASVAEFYREARHLTLGTPYAQVVYQPMVELIRFLEANGFTTYIVSGGERDFMRPMTEANYGIPAERVVGTGMGLTYDAETNTVRYAPKLAFFDDGPEKPVRIWMRTGRRPILAAGNSNGDVPMLRFAQGNPRSLALLVHHDDDTGRGDAPYDKGAEQALAADGITVISVRDDWAQVFPTA
ncbi:HAD family hydrolase [Microbacterium kyungheense]|uniref:Phosphoserine phosphatase n=1 Tax=Microbacterium kyungheense TaxID=1263636 RepID=A0A543EEV4_9MICO|nr:HAD family hydrolase [Microbacterium kyungheense]TQM18573.1 phosphoserine phosphatase [Microbacterium kyungheense]TQM20115.1 phosphoserine phosphatase [Microbacterium kyungheense]